MVWRFCEGETKSTADKSIHTTQRNLDSELEEDQENVSDKQHQGFTKKKFTRYPKKIVPV